MRQFSEYSDIIFDCDGVIFDSNNLKIEAMRRALSTAGFSEEQVESCKNFFSANFGKSRFYHIDYFLLNLLRVDEERRSSLREQILNLYSSQCEELYLKAPLAPGLMELFDNNEAKKYIASGSEQGELREVFRRRNLKQFFELVFGSPRKKSELVTDILKLSDVKNTVMIGDAVSDLEAAHDNEIDFIYYSPFSNVDTQMRQLCEHYDYRIMDSFSEVMK